ncbi:MAG: prolyl oligopeptidase family protein [Verrucomicrobia bacterium]|nr:prolyl oligopeptidase family protein [Verrucomicrobiota bacterium]
MEKIRREESRDARTGPRRPLGSTTPAGLTRGPEPREGFAMLFTQSSKVARSIIRAGLTCACFAFTVPTSGRAADPEAAATPASTDADPYLWLEDVGGAKPLDWVKARNAVTAKELEGSPEFAPLRDRLLAILDSKERIPGISKEGDYFYNFWRDAGHVRGLWRRTSLAEYRKAAPAWETVLDLDALSAAEKENWVWKGAGFCYPARDRALLELSRGGGDAVVIREFDVATKQFVSGGFVVPEAKTDVTWRDRDHVYVATNFGPGSLTNSGYARIIKEWTRGTPLADAKVVFEGRVADVGVGAWVYEDKVNGREFIRRSMTFYTSETELRQGDAWVKLDVPADAGVGAFQDQILVTLRSDWTVGGRTFPIGALLAMSWDRFLRGDRDFEMLFTPGPRTALAGSAATKHALIVNELDNVRNRLYVLQPTAKGWTRTPLATPEIGSVSVSGIDREESDDFFLQVDGFLTPSTLFLGTVGSDRREVLKQLPAFFNADGLEVAQLEAVSKDGTHVPYFQVSRKGLKLDGANPTLLYGYGGFRVSQTPSYTAGVGAAWLERGGVYVLANIRGGGEFGPKWHGAALKANRQRAYDDFIAIAEDLAARKVTSPAHLGIMGGSNGGLLMGVMLTERPDLFGAVVCQVPLLDMRRYHKLLAGNSWMGEYGDPDKPEEWAYISKYSPYQNMVAGKKYPRVLFTTSTRDDRVHPGHARKMAAKMIEQGHDILYYENVEGGHGGAANNAQRAYMSTLAFTFLWNQLK